MFHQRNHGYLNGCKSNIATTGFVTTQRITDFFCNFNFYLKVSAIRFFLTRIYDLNFNLEGDVKHKNPLEFFEIFKFHEKNNLQDFF